MLSFRDAHDSMSNGCVHRPSGLKLTRQGLVCLAFDKYLGHFRMCEARRYPEATTSVGLHIEGLNLGEKTMGLQGSRPIHPCTISSYPLHPPWSITAIQVQRHHPHTPSISLLLPYLPSSLHTILVNCGGSDAPGMELPAPVLEGSERQVVSPFSAHARARYQSGDSLEPSGTLPPTPGSLGLDAVRQATILRVAVIRRTPDQTGQAYLPNIWLTESGAVSVLGVGFSSGRHGRIVKRTRAIWPSQACSRVDSFFRTVEAVTS
jgi:hypothetical protein